MTITAKFPSQCPTCRQPIVTGDRVEWARGQRATHTSCPAAPAVATPEPARMTVEEKGVYVLTDGSICKVKPNLAKTRTYAERWTVIGGTRVTEAGTFEHGEYVFEPGLVQKVATEGRKMTLDEATAFTLRFGQCVRCGRQLKDAKSVLRSLGPVCVKYFSAGTTGADLLAA